MNDREIMKLALEALIAATPVKAKDPQMQAAAIVALREALAEQPAPQPAPQPEQEPVAILYPALSDTDMDKLATAVNQVDAGKRGWFHIMDVALSIAQQPPQPEQEPVAWGVFDGPNLHDMFFTEQDAQDMARLKGDGSVVKPLCTTPPQRTWVGLTNEDYVLVNQLCMNPIQAAEFVDHLLKELNNG